MILDRLFGIENRTAAGLIVTGAGVDQDATLKKVFGSWGTTYAGQTVNEETCMGLSAFYAGVRLLSSTPAALPVCVYRRTNDAGDKEIARDNPVYTVLHDRPNPVLTPIQFREIGQMFILLWGRSLSYIERDGVGRPVGLWPMHTNEVRLNWRDGARTYDISRIRNNDLFPKPPTSKMLLSDTEVLDVSSFDGKSIVGRAREQLGEAMAAQAFGAGFFGGGAQPYLVLKSKKVLTPEATEKLRENWSRKHGGARRNIAVLEDDLEVQPIDMPLKDAQFLESRQFYVTEIARWFGIPPHKLYDLLRSTNNNIEEQQLEWYEDLIPHLVRWEQELHWKLFSPAERKDYLIGHIVENMLRGNIEKRYQAYSTGLQWGFMDRDQVRRLENWNAYGEGAEVPMVPNNMTPATAMGQSQGGGVGGAPMVGDSAKGDVAAPADAKTQAADVSGQPIQTATDLVLNGAQITAATAIVVSVTKGEQPRDAGVGQLTILFNLTNEQAEQIMGSAGTSTPTTPNPNPAADVQSELTPEQVVEPPAAPDEKKKAARSSIQSALARMVRKETAEVREAAKDPAKFLNWLDRFYGGWRAKMADGIGSAAAICCASGVPVNAEGISAEHCTRSKAALLELSGCKPAEFSTKIATEMDRWQSDLPDQLTNLVFQETRK